MTQKKEAAPLTAADVQKLIDDAIAKHGNDQGAAIKGVSDALEARFAEHDKTAGEKFDTFAEQQKTLVDDRFNEFTAQHEADREAFKVGLAEHGKAQDSALAEKFDALFEGREQRKADAAAGVDKAAAAAQEKESARLVSADKAAAKKLEAAEKAKADAAQKRVDRASRDYRALIDSPVPSKLTPETAQTITLRLGDGSTFHPEHELTLGSAELHHESDRLVNSQVIPLPADFTPFTASEAILIVEGGKEPAALYRSPIESALRFGGGASAQLAVGALAFRRLSPEPEATA